ncbi:MAG: FkbM family methyltransferase [Bacteroidetes bacterium]|jgi:FkbM family methyltransferase|nr:FkbM family methyltransferase [Bacteroidota bacterium]MDF1865966.1 FkbM family methyltransferase [Saprospiraceae bacterium]
MIDKIIKLIPWKIRKPIRDLLSGKSIEEVDIVYKIFQDQSGKGKIMLDVGAHFGTALMPFAKKDWTIYAFEPDPSNREKLIAQIADYKNVTIDIRAASNTTGDTVSFFTSEVSTGISSMSAFHKSHKETSKVQTIRLGDFCKENKINDVDFLKIDTEGFDLFVLKGYDWVNQKHPDYIVTEFEDRKTKPLGYSFQEQANYLIEQGYKVIVSEWHPIIEYGQRHKWKRFVTNPSQVTDELAWGNIIACKPENFEKLKKVARKIGKIVEP